jgi:type III secretion protein J
VEKEAVEMQAILLSQGIDCDKIAKKNNLWELRVSKSVLFQAIEILKGYGYPRDDFVDMATMFKKEGLVSSAMEERVRYIYALSQEIARTISKIDGLINARVHIVLPENDALSEYFQPSSASVFIKHRPSFDIQSQVHQIKQLVVNSVEGLSYEKVTVVPFSSSVLNRADIKYSRIFGIEIVSEYLPRFQILVYGLIFCLSYTIAACCYLLWKTYKLQDVKSNLMQIEEKTYQ